MQSGSTANSSGPASRTGHPPEQARGVHLRNEQTYRFSGFHIDVERREISRDGKPLVLEPRAFDVLIYLLERRERVVPLDELISAVWGSSDVNGGALAREVAKIRMLFGGETESVIRTIRRVGFRFVADRDVALGPRSAARGEDVS